jgi:PKD repeat protein
MLEQFQRLGGRAMRQLTSTVFVLLLAGGVAGLFCGPKALAAAGDPTVGFYGAPESGPAPLEVHFHPVGDDAVIQSMTNWSWDFGDGNTSTEDYTSHEYTNPGSYTVTLKATSSSGQTYTVTKQDYIRVMSGGSGEMPENSTPEPATNDAAPANITEPAVQEAPAEGDSLVFIHHSCGENWLNSGLHDALVSKDYVDRRNDITYGVEVAPDPGRPASLGPVAGELTDMHHWILWFNDYLGNVRQHGCASGENRIVIFKSCFPNSHVDDAGAEPGDPFSDWKTEANYRAVYRHPAGSGNTYEMDGVTYRPLEDIFAANPQTLFVIVTAPPECWNDTNEDIAAHARASNDWLTGEWLPEYLSTTGLRNVAVFDWFDLLACPANDSSHPNQLRADYGGGSGDSHPNDTANRRSTQEFASDPGNWLDHAWEAFQESR